MNWKRQPMRRTCRENIKKPDRKVFIKAEQDTWNY